MEGSTQKRDDANAHLLRRGHRRGRKDRLDVVLWPSGEYVEATNDERGIRLRRRWCAVCVRRTWRWAVLESHRGAPAARRRRGPRPRRRRGGGGDRQPQAGRDQGHTRLGHGLGLAKRPSGSTPRCALAHFAEAVRPESHAPCWPRRARPRTLGRGVLRRQAPDPSHVTSAARLKQGAHTQRDPEGREEEDRGAPALAEKKELLARVEGEELERVVKESLVWEGEGGPPPHERPRGVGPTLSATLLWRSCPSWSTSTPQAARRAGGRGGASQEGLRDPARDTHRVCGAAARG